ncbi:glycosyltransferase [Acidithiobacillus sp. IBUN Pt1247-S3]|uniref:glycosyltransferase n=1 Tax=Acidithiobacillus sp. IBUN Pt1247-S3 TaxID=3166642 RepID=UPI0034E5C418
MRIVIDMQGVQAENRLRGIGRFTMALAQAVVRNRGEHEVIVALSGMFPDTIEPIRAAFDGLLSRDNIRVWIAPGPLASVDSSNGWRRQTAELLREAFLASLRPDIILVTSLFEGFWDDAVTSIGLLTGNIPVAVILYDLIPYIHRKPYLENPEVESWYLKKIEFLRKADLLLAISESTRQEGVSQLDFTAARVVNIASDVDTCFRKLDVSADAESLLREKYGLPRPFVMYTGGIDHRKNIEGLIRAYARLPQQLREAHQLTIVCSVQPGDRQRLAQLATNQGLAEGAVVFTGFVPEEDLIALYNLCALFVFPSWHEGFGLPALEAMRCGAPVIAANTSSLPEVVGLQEALFDPHCDAAIAEAMQRGLIDNAFRSRLVEHGKTQATKFSWDETARRAIQAMERGVAEYRNKPVPTASSRLKMAYVSPLPPERSGIASYSAELLPKLARHYDIEVIVAQDEVADPWIKANCPTRSVDWFIENADHYDRVLYHFGNSAFHRHMFGMLKDIPGVVVLHDFYLAGVLHYMEALGYEPGIFTHELFNSHGYTALRDRCCSDDISDIIWKYPCNLCVIQRSLGIIAHSANTLRLAKQWYGLGGEDWSVIPHMRAQEKRWEKSCARKTLGLKEGVFVVCSFGMLGPTKLNHRLLQAWLDSSLSQSGQCHLVFVGENHPGEYGQHLAKISGRNRNIQITGWADEDLYFQYLAAADIGVQLRTLSRGETSGTVLDCMNYGLATIVNANGSMADLDSETVWMLPDEFRDDELATALETLWRDTARRQQLGENARQVIISRHNPSRCADQYRVAIEQCYASENNPLPALNEAIARIPGVTPKQVEWFGLASAMASSFPAANAQRQLLVDISELVQRDAKSGIQRVVRSILKEWLANPPEGYRVEPVYATVDHGYRYARCFTAAFMDCLLDGLSDEPIDFAPGDVFFGLDLQPQVQVAQRGFYRDLRNMGVRTVFAVYDLLCVRMPEFFVPHADEGFARWLEVVAEGDGAVCISSAIADELAEWVTQHASQRQRPFKIDWFHLGADVASSAPPTKGLPAEAESVFGQFRARPGFLVVGTLEPRKGHAQVLDAFEQLWQADTDANLIIVGKQGWQVEALAERLRSHPERNKRLFWLEGISDEYLEKVYAASTCLIAASYGEGFGLPLIEAAQHKLPIIARDIPVFREVAGEHAFYFNAESPDALAEAVNSWLRLFNSNQHPKSDEMPWLTWEQSARQLLAAIGVP